MGVLWGGEQTLSEHPVSFQEGFVFAASVVHYTWFALGLI